MKRPIIPYCAICLAMVYVAGGGAGCEDQPPATGSIGADATPSAPDAAPSEDASVDSPDSMSIDPGRLITECTRLAATVAVCTDPACVEGALARADFAPETRAAYERMVSVCRKGEVSADELTLQMQRCTRAEEACLGPWADRAAVCATGATSCASLVDNCLAECGEGRDIPCEACVQCSRFTDLVRARELRTCQAERCPGETDDALSQCARQRCTLVEYACSGGARNTCRGAPFIRASGDEGTLCERAFDDSEGEVASCLCLCGWLEECLKGFACRAPTQHPHLGDYVKDIGDICRNACDDESQPLVAVLVPVGCEMRSCSDLMDKAEDALRALRGETEVCAPDAPLCERSPEFCFECLEDRDCCGPDGDCGPEGPRYCSARRLEGGDRLTCYGCDPRRRVSTCGDYAFCEPGEGETAECAVCDTDDDCGALICTRARNCECASDEQCGGLPCVRGQCVCDTEHPCGDAMPICDASRCRECRPTDECGPGRACVYGRCVPEAP